MTASTQNQALSAILFLYRDVIGTDLPWLDEIVRAQRPDTAAGGAHARRGPGGAPPATTARHD